MKSYLLTTLAACISMAAFAGDSSDSVKNACSCNSGAPSDLTLGNFFSEGWSQDWLKRQNPDGAPDMALLRVQTNFLEREWRTDYSFENDVNSASKLDIHNLDTLIAYGLDRRIMLQVVGIYQWVEPRAGKKAEEGGSEALGARIQLVDTQTSSYALNFRAQAPNDGLGDKYTTLNCSLAGWNDLTPLGLDKVGLYYHVMEESYVGTVESGAKHNDMTYDVSLAKTWTGTDAVLRNFTTFVETYATTDLDGSTKGTTAIGLTPGIRFTLGRGQVFMLGADIPLSTPRAYNGGLYRFTYIYNF